MIMTFEYDVSKLCKPPFFVTSPVGSWTRKNTYKESFKDYEEAKEKLADDPDCTKYDSVTLWCNEKDNDGQIVVLEDRPCWDDWQEETFPDIL